MKDNGIPAVMPRHPLLSALKENQALQHLPNMVKIKYAAENIIVSRRAEAWNTPYNPIAGVMVNTATLNQRTPLIAGNPLRTVVPIVAPGSDAKGSSAVALFF